MALIDGVVYGFEVDILVVLLEVEYHFTALLVVADNATVPVPHLDPPTPTGAAGLFTTI